MSDLVFPELVARSSFASEDDFIEACYAFFKADFLDARPVFRNTRMGLKSLPKRNGKEATFYHMTTTGNDEENRTLDVDRSERIRWAKPVIENESHNQIRVWTERHRGQARIHLWHHDEDYVLVIAARNGYYLPWTAFYINYSNYRQKLERRWIRNR